MKYLAIALFACAFVCEFLFFGRYIENPTPLNLGITGLLVGLFAGAGLVVTVIINRKELS